MDCPFCHLDKVRNRVVEEKKYVFVILSNPRLAPGHLLVIPKRHIEKPAEMIKEEREEMFETVLEYQAKVLARFAGGCDIRQNYRPFQKQDNIKVDHVHFHLLPREFKDELYERCQKYETDIFRILTEEEKERLVRLFA